MGYIIGQIFSALALIISVIIAQFKTVKSILLGEILANIVIALSYVFLGGISGAWICMVAALQTIIIYLANKRGISSEKRNILVMIFAGIYIMGTLVVYQGKSDIVSCICSVLYVMALIQTDTKKYRWFMIANSVLWIVYDISVLAYINMITHGMLLISLIIAMIRYNVEAKNGNSL